MNRQDYLDILQDILTGTGRIPALVARHPILRQRSQDAIREIAAETFQLYRTVQVRVGEDLRPEHFTSGTLLPRVAVNIASEMPGMVFRAREVIHFRTVLLRYVLDADQVIAYVPLLTETIPPYLRRQRIRDEIRPGPAIPVSEILDAAEHEQEVFVDIQGQPPAATLEINTTGERLILNAVLNDVYTGAENLILEAREHGTYFGVDDTLRYHHDKALQEVENILQRVLAWLNPDIP